jgi:hypothetical protein
MRITKLPKVILSFIAAFSLYLPPILHAGNPQYGSAFQLMQRALNEIPAAQTRDLTQAKSILLAVYNTTPTANVAYAIAYTAAKLNDVVTAEQYLNLTRALNPPLAATFARDQQTIQDWIASVKAAPAQMVTSGNFHSSAATADIGLRLPPSSP